MVVFLKQMFNIISKKDKKKLFGIFLMILISSFLDLIGVGIIIPIVSLLSAPSTSVAIEENTILKILSTLFNTTDSYKLSIISLIFIVILYFIKTVYSLILTYVTARFTMTFNKRLRTKLMRIYLSMPYEYHHENNSSTLIRKSTYDVDVFCTSVRGFIAFFIKIITALTISIYLFITSYIITLIVGVLLISFSLFNYYVLRNRNKVLGRKIQELNGYNYKYLSQSFNGIKESKISNTEDFFVNEYVKNIEQINHYSLRVAIYHSIPGHTLEFIGMLGMAVALLIIILMGGVEKYHIISIFSVFAYAVIKLLPCITEITSYLNNFSFYSASVTTIHKDLEDVSKLERQLEQYEEHDSLLFNKCLTISNVSFAYKDEPGKNVLSNVSFTITKNTSVAISGNSGAGKTTLVDVLLGLLKPTTGSISCDNTDIQKNIRGWRDNLSYVPQNIYLIDDTIRNNVAFGIDKSSINDDEIWDALDRAELKSFVKSTPKGLDTIIGEAGIRLSGGQRQRIGIARAFYRNTNIIVLDEATSALDYETEKNILDHVSQYSKDHTLIIITHRLNTIESCDFIYKIEDGHIKCISSKK